MKTSLFTRACSTTLATLMVLSLCAFDTGCSQTQFDKDVAVIQAQIPAAENFAVDLANLIKDPVVAAAAQKIGTAINVDLPNFKAVVAAYVANKTTSTKAAIFASIQTFVADINAGVLAANGITNPSSQAALLAKLNAFGVLINGMELLLSPFFNSVVKAKADFRSIQPYVPRDLQEATAERFGYTLGQLGL